MNKNKSLNGDIPPTTSDFMIDVEGNITKKRFVGEFSCKIMNKKDTAMVAKHRAYLNGDMADFVDPLVLRLHMMISYLRYALTEYPKWWKEADLGYELYDENVIKEVYDQVLNFEEEWYKQIWGEDAVENLRDEAEGEQA